MPETPISLFISYAHADSAFVDRLEADLQKEGFDPWVDRQRLKGGQRWRRELQDAVKGAQVLLLVLSPDAITSENVQIEYDYVLELGNVVIPLYYRQCEVPMELRAIQWIDFRQSYEQGIAALLQVLHQQQDKITPSSAQTQPAELVPQPIQQEPAKTGHSPFNNLPAQLTALIGREQEIQGLCAIMRQPEVRLVTLLGPGGVGKTRLGLAVAQSLLSEFAEGVCFVPLAPIRDVEQVIPTPMELAINAEHHGAAMLRAGKFATVQTRSIGDHDHLCGNEVTFYPPLTETAHSMPAVALSDVYRGPGLGVSWDYHGKRSAFVGTFAR